MSILAFLILTSVSLSASAPGQEASVSTSQDCRECPSMVVVDPSEGMVGTPAEEHGRYANEPAPRLVALPRFAIGETEVTRREYAAFLAATGRVMEPGCYTPGDLGDLLSDLDQTKSWTDPGFAQDDNHPVVCVSWHEAVAYTKWLTEVSGHTYRLPTESEWELAARAGTDGPFFWGAELSEACEFANGGDLSLGEELPRWAELTEEARRADYPDSVLFPCYDGYAFTAPVRSYPPNGLGLFDILGNAWEWTADCGDDAADGDESCRRRRTRGGSWDDWPIDMRAGVRKRLDASYRRSDTGFRVVRELGTSKTIDPR